MRDATHPEISKKLKKWQDKYSEAKQQYQDELDNIARYEKLYAGDRHVNRNPNKGGGTAKNLAINVRNIVFDLIESEVDSAIPFPKVIPIHEEDKRTAKIIEAFLKAEIETQHLKAKNDIKERITPVTGGSYDCLEWDNTVKTHCSVGDLAVNDLHPKQVIPQAGGTDIETMDYIFVRTSQTRDYIKRRWGKNVEEEDTEHELDDKDYEDLVELVTVYYRNSEGGIGMYRWCGDVEIEDFEDYQARYIKKCKECGKTVTGDKCECGSKSFEIAKDEIDKIKIKVPVVVTDENGVKTYVYDEQGNIVVEEQEVEIPYYKPNCFPIVLRKNISKYRSLLGFSDAAAIEDQQDTIKKLGSKINEKLLKAGSIMTLPEGLQIDTTDAEFKIARIKNPSEMSMIQVLTCQADVSKDMAFLETNYQWAKSALGITDAYQGKYDSSATSGAAKQYSINQAAGRLESKRVMKNEAYAKLYEMMFKFALAYFDQPVPIAVEGLDGEAEYSHFDKADFVKFDDDGNAYLNDEFIFTIDTTSTLLTNRQAMWDQNNMMLQSGAYGPLADLRTNRLFWLEQERNGYPNAGEVLAEIDRRLEEQKEQEALTAQMPQEGVTNEMPNM